MAEPPTPPVKGGYAAPRGTERIEHLDRDDTRRKPGEVEFHQAVREVIETLGPVLDKSTLCARANR